MPSAPGKLWIVATPIGNNGDFSPRARRTLEECDGALAEDTRRAKRLFAACGMRIKKLTSFFEHNEDQKQAFIIKELQNGKNFALISDAGTPLLADPGYRLVAACRENGIPVSSIPGPSAITAALSVAGIPPIPFTFLGFLPRSDSSIQNLLRPFASLQSALVFFERKDRLKNSLRMAWQILGNRCFVICRELTKPYEEFIEGELQEHEKIAADLKGELTVIIAPGGDPQKLSEEIAENLLRAEMGGKQKTREIIKKVLPQCAGWTARELYNLAEKLK